MPRHPPARPSARVEPHARTAAGANLPDEPGVYALWLRLQRPLRLNVGALGEVPFRAGHYLYLGSAGSGLRRRLKRYLQGCAHVFWHIDHLLPHVTLIAICLRKNLRLSECELRRRLAAPPHIQEGPPGFGSSDCRCSTHLLYSRASPGKRLVISALFDEFLRVS
jgi:Uri superfamily endonuclease